jgi:hypothetical protein
MKPEEKHYFTISRSIAWIVFLFFLLLVGIGVTFYLINRGKSVYFEVDETGRIRKVRA